MINSSKRLSTNASDVIGYINNAGFYVLTGGENNNQITGTGTTMIDGDVINYECIENPITINQSKKLTTYANGVQKGIINSGELILIGNGTLNSNIWTPDTGRTIIDGEVINGGTIVNPVIINENKKLITSATNILGVIENNGYLVFNEGNNEYSPVYGTGTTVIDGDVINGGGIGNSIIINENKKLITNAADVWGTIENDGSLVFNGGINNNVITGTGLMQINDDVINQANITQKNLEILSNQLINSTATITINELLTINNSAKIINDGKLVIGKGTNYGTIEQTTNTSTMTIAGNFINWGTIKQNKLNIEQNGELQTTPDSIIGNIENNGTISFYDGINANQITGSGTLNINAEEFINNNIIEQTLIAAVGFYYIPRPDIGRAVVDSISDEQEEIIIMNHFVNNSIISAENLDLMFCNFTLTENGSLFVENLSAMKSEINVANSILQQHNFKAISLADDLILSVDADLENKEMDTIYANSFNGDGKINIKAINILSDAIENKTEVLFTSSTILKDKIISIDTANSKLFKYDVNYDKSTGDFNFLLTVNKNPVIAESQVAGATGLITQTTVLNQAFSSVDNIKNRIIQAKQKGLVYASTADVLFDGSNRIESGLWIRPFIAQDSVSFDSLNVDNTLTGTLAGIDLATGENSLVSFYLGYAGSNQKYEDIKINQTGYILGATGMLIKDKWYAGLTANINFNKAEGESDYGTDSFDLNMFSVGAKTGYNFDLSNKFVVEPNLTLMYGNISNQEYETTQGAKIDSQSVANIIVEPQVKAKFNLNDGWQPYGLLGYLLNSGEKAKLVADNIAFNDMGISGYVEYGFGVNKTFKNSAWSCYIQATGRSGDINGFNGNLGIKYSFLNKKEKEDIKVRKSKN